MVSFLIDLDGVIYKSSEVIPGAVDSINKLIARDQPFMFVTNTSSRPRRAIRDKLHGFGLEIEVERILTPPVAARFWIQEHCPGPVALFVPQATHEDFTGITTVPENHTGDVSAVIIGDLGEDWSFKNLNKAFQFLMREPAPRLLALGMTRYWLANDGLRLDVAPFAKALEHASGCEIQVLGKPAEAFFQTALKLLGCNAAEAIMIGDDIRGDVKGAQDAGLKAALVRTGKFRPQDLQGEITVSQRSSPMGMSCLF